MIPVSPNALERLRRQRVASLLRLALLGSLALLPQATATVFAADPEENLATPTTVSNDAAPAEGEAAGASGIVIPKSLTSGASASKGAAAAKEPDPLVTASGEDVVVTLKYPVGSSPKEVLDFLAQQVGIPAPEFQGDPKSRVALNLVDVPVRKALTAIAAQNGQYWWRTKEGKFVVGEKDALALAVKAGGVAESSDSSVSGDDAEEAPAPVEEARVTGIYRNGKIETVLQNLSDQAKVRIVPEGKALGTRVDLAARDMPLTEALDQIAQPKGLVWWKKKDGSYGLADKAYYEQNILPEQAIQRIFRPNYISAEDFDKAIKPILTPKIGSSAVDPRTNKVIVKDLPAVIELINRLLQEVDVQLVWRVFQIQHANVDDVAKQIEDYKSGPGTIKVDQKGHQIIVNDLLQNIKRMEMLIDILDVGPEMIVYDVHNLGDKGQSLKDLKTIIDNIRTKDLLFEINDKAGTFVLEDVPEVHNKVEKILQAFDQPMKQINMQAEVLSTTFRNNYNFQLDWQLSSDLFSAARDGVADVPLGKGDEANGSLGYRNLSNTFPYGSGTTGFTDNTRGLSITNLNKDALLTLQAAMSDKTTNVILQPRLQVKNQEEARIFVGSEEPFLSTYYNNNNNNNNNYTGQSTQQVVPAGLTMTLTPGISNVGLVELDISLNDDLAQRIEVPDGDNGTASLIRRERKEVKTRLTVPSGETRMIGGLLRNESSESKGGIPFLYQIPIIGPIFGAYGSSIDKRNLMVFLTPTVIEEKPLLKKTKIGRRGRNLAIEESAKFDAATTGTLLSRLEPAVDDAKSENGEAGKSLADTPLSKRSGATLSSGKAEAEEPYLLGHDSGKTGAGKSRSRTSSYEASVGAPSGSITSTTAGASSRPQTGGAADPAAASEANKTPGTGGGKAGSPGPGGVERGAVSEGAAPTRPVSSETKY